jgi:CubicO group peptidase (beta-lactamase class C family)
VHFSKIKLALLTGLAVLFLSGLSANAFSDDRPDDAQLERIDAIVRQGIRSEVFPGCQIVVLRDGVTVFQRSYGSYTYDGRSKVTDSTLYDLASLTKVTATLLAVMKLYDECKLGLDDSISAYLPFLKGTDKGSITIRQLLVHESGLPASLNAYRWISTRDTLHRKRIGTTNYIDSLVSIFSLPEFGIQVSDSLWIRNDFKDTVLNHLSHLKLGSRVYLYSCVNFIVLKEVVESISGLPLNLYLDSIFYRPMGLDATFLPLRKHSKEDMAPTLRKDFLRGTPIQGYVQDPDAALLGGVSGNAGLFASARDVARICQLFLNGGELDGKRYLSAETCRTFTTVTSASKRRGLGFDKPVLSNPAKSPCCVSAPASVYGHTGYTGTCCWVDPQNRMVYVFLSNRTYPNDQLNKLARTNIRTRIQELLYQSIKKR